MAGVKYVNFEEGEYNLALEVMPKGQKGKIAIKLDDPTSEAIAMFEIDGEVSQEFTTVEQSVGQIEGKHAVFFVFYAEGEGEICEFNHFEFRMQ